MLGRTTLVLEQPQPPWGEPRIERFREARGRLPGRAAARVVLPAFALWHAVTLHAVWTIGALELAHREGTATHDLDPAGLLGRGRHVLARYLVLGGMHARGVSSEGMELCGGGMFSRATSCSAACTRAASRARGWSCAEAVSGCRSGAGRGEA